MTTILVAEDEPQIAQIARDYLEHAGFQVVVAADGGRALDLARRQLPDLVVLDLGLPTLDGIEVAAALRREGDVPIIMLTARVDESDRLRGLEVGADDYVTKPFSPRELVARVRAVLRRAHHDPGSAASFRRGDLIIDSGVLSVRRDDVPIELTASEFQILAALARKPGRVFTRAQLLDAARGEQGEAFDRAVDAHIKNIRRKIEPDPRNPRYVLTVYGVGYKFADV
jgi:two-component system alkaline phosphatase synthesis response regulator PhoP